MWISNFTFCNYRVWLDIQMLRHFLWGMRLEYKWELRMKITILIWQGGESNWLMTVLDRTDLLSKEFVNMGNIFLI